MARKSSAELDTLKTFLISKSPESRVRGRSSREAIAIDHPSGGKIQISIHPTSIVAHIVKRSGRTEAQSCPCGLTLYCHHTTFRVLYATFWSRQFPHQ
jgi:hypothetical protein